jgi:hypothetical protein
MPKPYELMELIRRKASMSAEIVSKKDAEYGYYSGANWNIASKMAMVDTILKNNLVTPSFQYLIKLYRSYLDQQRKAFFASVGSTEITKLGFIQGDPRIVMRATDPAE